MTTTDLPSTHVAGDGHARVSGVRDDMRANERQTEHQPAACVAGERG